jgi:hypothetical protein
MIRIGIVLAIFVFGACGKSVSDELKDDIAKEQARRGPDPVVEAKPVKELPPKKEKKAEEPPDPEPTTPDEIDKARKKAMIAGKDKDVIRFCEMGKLSEATDPQVTLGCTLAACRINDADKAKTWAAYIVKSKKAKDAKPLFEQAVKTCMANKVVL